MSQHARAHPCEPHPFEHQLTGGSWITQDERDEILAEHYCSCDLELTMEEIDRGKCAACGKEIL